MTKTCKVCGNPNAWGSGLPGSGTQDYTDCDACGSQTQGGTLARPPKPEAFDDQDGKGPLVPLATARALGLIHSSPDGDVIVTHGKGEKGAASLVVVRKVTDAEKAALKVAGARA